MDISLIYIYIYIYSLVCVSDTFSSYTHQFLRLCTDEPSAFLFCFMWAVLLLFKDSSWVMDFPAGSDVSVCVCVCDGARLLRFVLLICLSRWMSLHAGRKCHRLPCGCAEFSFPPDSARLPPLSAAGWTSTYNYKCLIDALMQSSSLKRNSKANISNKTPQAGEQECRESEKTKQTNNTLIFYVPRAAGLTGRTQNISQSDYK